MINSNESKAMSLQMVEIDHQQFAVELMSDNVNVNLTQMAKPFGSSNGPNFGCVPMRLNPI